MLNRIEKKVGLFLDARPSYGGAYQYNLLMAEAIASLPKDRYDVVAAYTHSDWVSRIKELNLTGMPVYLGLWKILKFKRISGRLPVRFWRSISPFFLGFVKSILAQQCDLWIFPSQDTWTYLMPVPALVTIYDLMHRYERRFPEVSAFGRYSIRERHFKKTCQWAKGILVDSEIGKQHVIESYKFGADQVHVLPYVAPKYINAENVPNGFDEHYRLPEKFLFYPAQFWLHKNHQNLLLALRALSDRFSDMNLVLSGAPKNGYSSVQKMVRSLCLEDRVKVLSYIPDEDIMEIYRRARALIMPSYFGPTNIPPLEAAFLGCPMAISDIYGARDQMGEAALYFDPSSPFEISYCIEKLWTDNELCKVLIERGYQLSQKYNQSKYNKTLLEIIEKMLSNQAQDNNDF